MGENKDPSADLVRFLASFPDDVKGTALWLREFVYSLYPGSNELIYDNYNALAVGFATSDKAGDAFCSMAVYSKYVNFGFNRGSEISDPDKILSGNGSLYRYIRVTNKKDFPQKYIKKLLREAYANSLARLKENKQVIKGITLTKMALKHKRRPL